MDTSAPWGRSVSTETSAPTSRSASTEMSEPVDIGSPMETVAPMDMGAPVDTDVSVDPSAPKDKNAPEDTNAIMDTSALMNTGAPLDTRTSMETKALRTQVNLCPSAPVDTSRRGAHSDCVALWWRYIQYGGESGRNRPILTELSVKVRPFLFQFTIDKCNLIQTDCEEVFYVRICRVFSWTNAIPDFLKYVI